MQKLLLLLLLLSLSGCANQTWFRPSWIDENYFAPENWQAREGTEDEISPEDFDGPLGGHFNEQGEWIPDDKTIELTYRIPDISGSFLVDVGGVDSRHLQPTITPGLQIEIFEFDLPIESGALSYLRTWVFDIGVAYQRAYGFIGPRLTSIFEIAVGFWGGWNWQDNEPAFGIGIGIIRF